MIKIFFILLIMFIQTLCLHAQPFWIKLDINTGGRINAIVVNDIDEIFWTDINGNLYKNKIGESKIDTLIKSDFVFNSESIIQIDNEGYLYTDLTTKPPHYVPLRSTDNGTSWEWIYQGFDNKDSVAQLLHSYYRGDIFAYFCDLPDNYYFYKFESKDTDEWNNIFNIEERRAYSIKDLCYDKDGNMYLLVNVWGEYIDNNIIFNYDLKKQLFSIYKDTITNVNVTQISIDLDGNIYRSVWDNESLPPLCYLEKNDKNEPNWEIINCNLDISIYNICSGKIIAVSQNEIYLFTYEGIYKCDNYQFIFKPFNEGFEGNIDIYGLHLSKKGYLFFGTSNGNIYVSSKPVNDVKDDSKTIENKILCYPNPTTSTINLRYRIETAGMANIFLTDVLGNQTLLKSEYKFPGDYVETFNLSGYPQGIYNVVLQTNGKVFSEKVVKVE
ncbi:MAG: T9SS type A sorting domain-containing protein [bacterium]